MVAMTDPTNVFAMDEIRYRTGYHIRPLVATATAVHAAIEKYLGKVTGLERKEGEQGLMELDDPDVEVLEETEELDLDELERGSEDAPVVQLGNHILTDAVRRGASDIHIEPFERELRVRCRIDGILYLVMNLPLKLKENITTRIKILAKLDIAERRIPQGGRFKIFPTHIAFSIEPSPPRIAMTCSTTMLDGDRPVAPPSPSPKAPCLPATLP